MASPLRQRPGQLFSEDQGVSPQKGTRAFSHTDSKVSILRDQGISSQTRKKAAILKQRAGRLPSEMNQGMWPWTEMGISSQRNESISSPKEIKVTHKKTRAFPLQEKGFSPQTETCVSPLRKGPECLPSDKDQGISPQKGAPATSLTD